MESRGYTEDRRLKIGFHPCQKLEMVAMFNLRVLN